MATSVTESAKHNDDVAHGGTVKEFRPSFSDIVTVLAGPDEQRFTVHQDLICNSSGFFRAACSSSWKEAEQKTVRLPGIYATEFTTYLETLYGSSVAIERRAAKAAEAIVGTNFAEPAAAMSRVNAIMDTILQPEREFAVTKDFVEHIVGKTKPKCGLQEWVADKLVTDLTEDTLQGLEGKLSAEFLMELLKRMLVAKESRKAPTFADRCKYHEHPDGEERCT